LSYLRKFRDWHWRCTEKEQESALHHFFVVTPNKVSLIFVFIAALASCLVAILHYEYIKVDPRSAAYEIYRDGFTTLIEHELSQNAKASEPKVTIREITETDNELSINYDVKFSERYSSGENISRSSSGWALLRKDHSKNEWKLYQLKNVQQVLRFTKGTAIGS